MTLRLVQCRNTNGERIVARVDGDRLNVLAPFATLYEFANHAIAQAQTLGAIINDSVSDLSLDYNAVYGGASEWKLLPPLDHPHDPAHCLVTGTGLSHRKSADNRNAMHASG